MRERNASLIALREKMRQYRADNHIRLVKLTKQTKYNNRFAPNHGETQADVERLLSEMGWADTSQWLIPIDWRTRRGPANDEAYREHSARVSDGMRKWWLRRKALEAM